jgi:hypothetical protein
MKNLTKEWFKKYNACEDGYKWVLSRKDITIKGTLLELITIAAAKKEMQLIILNYGMRLLNL